MMTYDDWKGIQKAGEAGFLDSEAFLVNFIANGYAPLVVDARFAEWLALESPYVIDCCAEVDEENLCLYANYILSIKGRTFKVSAQCGFGREEFYDQEVEEVKKVSGLQNVTMWEPIWE